MKKIMITLLTIPILIMLTACNELIEDDIETVLPEEDLQQDVIPAPTNYFQKIALTQREEDLLGLAGFNGCLFEFNTIENYTMTITAYVVHNYEIVTHEYNYNINERSGYIALDTNTRANIGIIVKSYNESVSYMSKQSVNYTSQISSSYLSSFLTTTSEEKMDFDEEFFFYSVFYGSSINSTYELKKLLSYSNDIGSDRIGFSFSVKFELNDDN